MGRQIPKQFSKNGLKVEKKDAGLSRNIFERQKDTAMVRRCLVYKLVKVSEMSKKDVELSFSMFFNFKIVYLSQI